MCPREVKFGLAASTTSSHHNMYSAVIIATISTLIGIAAKGNQSAQTIFLPTDVMTTSYVSWEGGPTWAGRKYHIEPPFRVQRSQ
jgi:hypothetical protein